MQVRDSIAKKLTLLNMLVGGGAVLLACAAFFAYDVNNLRQTMITDLAIQAQIIGSNAVSPLIFNDQQSAEKTLAALRASPHIIYAGIYTPSGQFFAGYWRDKDHTVNPPVHPTGDINIHWIRDGQYDLAQPIVFDGKNVG